jgi:Derlin-2/3
MEELIGYIPPVTKVIAGSALIVSTLCSINFIEAHDLFFDTSLILEKHEYWRVITTFLYFGSFGINTFIHLFALFQNSKMLEVMMFQGQLAEFLYFITLSCSVMLLLAPALNMYFLSDSLFMCITYLLSKKNREGRIALIGLPVNIPYAFLPYVFLMFGADKSKIIGMAIAHIYYFFEDVVPSLPTTKDLRLLSPPGFIRAIARRVEY